MTFPREDDPVGRFKAAGGHCKDPFERQGLVALERNAPSLFMIILRNPSLFEEATATPIPASDTLKALRSRFEKATRGMEDGDAFRRTLRRLRHQTVLRVALRELLSLEDIDTTSQQLADLAAAAVDAALRACTLSARQRHGPLRDSAGRHVPLAAIGMGKLGGRELNLGSDIDLCFFYGTEDARAEDGTSAHEFVSEIVQQAVRAIADVTDDGFVFRVDLRLRPEGSRGPIAMSEEAALRYYEASGQAWERVAWLRARAVAGHLTFGRKLVKSLERFVYARRVDPGMVTTTRRMVQSSRRELREDAERDLKVGRGGIREAEFFVQTLQLIWGGRYRKLRVAKTMEALKRLSGLGLVSRGEADTLAADWAFLRRVEHRLHLTRGYQTHQLPEPGETKARIAESLGFSSQDALDDALEAARSRVQTLFDGLLDNPEGETEPSADFEQLADTLAAGDVDIPEAQLRSVLAVTVPDAAWAHLQRLSSRPTAPFGPMVRARYPRLGPLLLQEVSGARDPDAALEHLSSFFGRLAGNWGFERLLSEHPRLTRRIVGLFGTSPTLSRGLIARPNFVFDLLGTPELIDEAGIRLRHREETSSPAQEAFVDNLRRLKTEIVLELGIGVVGGEITMETAHRRLSALAEAQLRSALGFASRSVEAALGPIPGALVLVALGKLGGAEVGFGSDLDLMFLYDALGNPSSGGEESHQITRIAQETMQLVSQMNTEGPGYEVDLRLRPGGARGMLVVSMDAFARYHASHSDDWERLALVRARPIAGDARLFGRVQTLLRNACGPKSPIDTASIAHVRARAERELGQERTRRYHAKVGFGALLDTEFMVQVLQLRHRMQGDAEIQGPMPTLGAIEHLLEARVIDDDTAEVLRSGYQFFRSVEQALALLDPHSDGAVTVSGPLWHRLQKQLSIRDRDRFEASEALRKRWQETAERSRALFASQIGDVPTRAPWDGPESLH